MATEIDHFEFARWHADLRPGGIGEQDLAGMRGSRQAGQAVECGRQVVAVAGRRLADLDCHAWELLGGPESDVGSLRRYCRAERV